MRSNFVSQKYGDIYFNPDDPESEKQYVFIEANRVAERIRIAESFTVAELGFGFGLNCALTLHAAKEVDCLHRLNYFSVDENLPPQTDIHALAGKLKLCRGEYEQLWASPSPPSPLSQRERGSLNFPLPLGEGSRVRVGDVLSFLNESDFTADCWYFDGFSPAKNPGMWSAEVFARAFALTRPGGTFSTYTSAGWVRRNLEAAGFVVEKVHGFGSKREMLTGFKPSSGAERI